MDQTVKVAVVRGDNRRGAVAQALALLSRRLADPSRRDVLIKPNLVSHRYQLPSTHARNPRRRARRRASPPEPSR